MRNINGKYQPVWMLLCATMGLAVSVSLCFAQGNRDAQIVAPYPWIAFPCDSLDPKVCFDIYQRRVGHEAPLAIVPLIAGEYGCWYPFPPWPGEGSSQLTAPPTTRTLVPFGYYPNQFGSPKLDVCSSRLTRIR
jgi:hypothetical protein